METTCLQILALALMHLERALSHGNRAPGRKIPGCTTPVRPGQRSWRARRGAGGEGGGGDRREHARSARLAGFLAYCAVNALQVVLGGRPGASAVLVWSRVLCWGLQ